MCASQQPSSAIQVIEADYTWTGERFESGVCVVVDVTGRITETGVIAQQPTLRLRDRALLPGMINVHSHAFQRGLRGKGETFPAGAGSFWSWREAMYALVESLDVETLHRLSVQAFEEMLMAGITTVGEFHYVRHDASLEGYALDEVIVRAARDAGIRMALLPTYYRTGTVGGGPLQGGQLRFHTRTPEEYWQAFDALKAKLDPAMHTMGAVAHSIRAAPIDEIAAIHEESIRRGLVFHMHVEEQPKEVGDCLERYGKTPMALFNERLAINPMFTAIHCTHTAAADMEAFIEAGGTVGLCPLTEGNLGDGVPALPRLLRADAHVAIGTDSNARLCFAEDLRWLEYVQRLLTQSRGVASDRDGSVARRLFHAATVDGARSLGIRAGRIAPGMAADFSTLDLAHPTLAGVDAETLLDGFIFGTGNEPIADVCVHGRWIKRR